MNDAVESLYGDCGRTLPVQTGAKVREKLPKMPVFAPSAAEYRFSSRWRRRRLGTSTKT
jgi:hypothetical protein